MKKPVAIAVIVIVVGIITAGIYSVIFPRASFTVGTPYLRPEGPGKPLMVFVPVTNIGRPRSDLGPGTLQVAAGIWGSPSDVVGNSLEGRQSFSANAQSRGSGPALVRIGKTSFVSPSRRDDSLSNNLFIGNIASKRKYPVHVGYGWRRDKLEGEKRFVIPPDSDVVIAEAAPK